MRRATRKIKLDANHKEVICDLRKQGVEVVEIFEPVDTVLKLGDHVCFCEIKIEGSDGQFSRKQLEFMAVTRMPVIIARNAAEAMRLLTARESLSPQQKDALAAFLAREKPTVKLWRPGTIKKVLAV